VVHAAVEQLDADGDAFLFGEGCDARQRGDAGIDPLGIGPTAPVAEHADDIGHTVPGGERERALKFTEEQRVIRGIVQPARNEVAAHGRVPHRAD
jgi:hypothetical protein